MPPDESEVSAMEKQTLIAHCLTYPNAVEDYPFADNDLTIMRHPSGGKWFACIMHLQGNVILSDPNFCAVLTKAFTRPGI